MARPFGGRLDQSGIWKRSLKGDIGDMERKDWSTELDEHNDQEPDTLRAGRGLASAVPVEGVLLALASYVAAGRNEGVEAEGRSFEDHRRKAAIALRAAVANLPELEVTTSKPFNAARFLTPPRVVRELAELDSAVTTFGAEGSGDRAIDKCRGEELVARLRALADENLELGTQVSRVIRRLTAIAQGKDVFLFGLAKAHSANWRIEAARKRTELEVLQRGRRFERTGPPVAHAGEPSVAASEEGWGLAPRRTRLSQ